MTNLFSSAVPILLVGAPGVGKTAHVQAKFDYAEVVLTSTLVEEDIAGLPYREGDYDYRTIPGIFRRLADADAAGKTTVLFLDELDKARRSVADTLLTLIASRRVGAAVLPARTCIAAAANPPEFGGGDGISDAMISRFAVVDYVPDVVRWADWADSQFEGVAARRVTAAVRCGEMPIFDMTGDGLTRRITTPRTITLTLHALRELGGGSDAFDSVARGLLTAATASQVLHFVQARDNEVMATASSVARKATGAKNLPPLLRL